MSGLDDHATVMEDWMLPSPSPRSFFSSMVNDGDVARSIPGFGQSQSQSTTVDQIDHSANISKTMAEPKTSSRGGLVERIAARAGFNAPRLNTESIRTNDLSKNQQIRSPYFTVPPGLSPTTLLESPVFLTNSLVQPSPTTGKLSFPTSGNELNSYLMSGGPDKGKENIFEDANTSSFGFKPVADSVSFPYLNAPNKAFPSVHSDKSIFQHVENNGGSNYLPDWTYNSVGDPEHSPPLDEPNEDGDPNNGGSPAEDGYNWRKYGQKQVKGSEYPRSYYKCTHSNCPVKKKVERSHEGHITEIIYKGAHNHLKPPPNRQSAHLDSGANRDFIWSDMQIGRPDNLGSYSNGANALWGQNGVQYEARDVADGSPTLSNDEDNGDDNDVAMNGSVSLGYGGEEDESEVKRRRVEAYAPEMSGPSRGVREPRVVVQTTSEVDILDDGYRWRKYGQKVVKGNPNPRSYYKCTSAGCNVRKHVERASHDLKSVITTYEGKHNHDVPAARNTGHGNTRGPHTLSTQQANAAGSSSHISRPESSQVHASGVRSEGLSLGSFGFPGIGSNPGYGFGMNQNGLASMRLAGLEPNQGTLPVFPGHTYLGHRSLPGNDMSFMMPKGEPKFEPVTDSSNASSVYQQLMNRLPLGPHM